MAVEGLENTPMVSVIVPTYNRAFCLAQTIQSVLDQTFFDWELVLVDNYSTDGTDDLIASYSDSRIKFLKIHNRGIIAASRNKGIRAATGRYVAFLDSDDGWLPGKLAASVEALERGSDLVYHDLYIFDKSKASQKRVKKLKTRNLFNPVFDDLLLNGNAINNSSVVVRKAIIEQVGYISEDPELVASEDYDAWLRISRVTDRFERLRGCYGWYAVGDDNITFNAHQSEKNIKKIIEIYFQNNEKSSPVWANYALARAYFKLGRYPESRAFVLKVMRQLPGLSLNTKAFIIYILSWFQQIKLKKT